MKKTIKTISIFALIATLFTVAFASVNFDAATGTGFVGKGDVQLAFGWNNQALQANAAGVTFSYNQTTTTGYGCEWYTGPERNRTRHEVSHNVMGTVIGRVGYDARVRNQITGFNLTGFSGDPIVTGGEVPAIGDPCPGNPGNGAVVFEVDEVSNVEGGLYVNYGASNVLLPY